ncbi:unnamed protein product [Eruca vesicaria subsp. sativa]|uniref:Uncharacterized protein n=1 Tax=Eruca vesicaria subsp. sativa TaxID=29727 RepID=A0ABC8KTV5_ERUVS|nr:unnamed protein product [Eruca vesicaria subsp. sativa]
MGLTIEDCNEPFIDSLREYDDGKDLSRYDFKLDEFTSPNDDLNKMIASFTIYDVTRKETFTKLVDVWSKEIELYSTNQDCVTMLVGSKVDRESQRGVSREEGIALVKELKCMFLECSARTQKHVEQCFEDLALKVKIHGLFILWLALNYLR